MRLRKEWFWLSFLLVVIGLLTLPVGKNNCVGILQAKAADDDAIVAEGECGEKLTYRVQRMTTSSWELVIEGDGKMNDYTEAAKAPWYYYRNSITKITTPVGLDSIGDYAFYDMQKVTEISLTRGITRIGDYAFYRCMSWDPGTGDFLPDYLNIIEDGAFEGCSKITTVYIPADVKTVGRRAFACMNGLTTIHFPTGKFQMELGEQLFASSRVLTTVTLPENIETITDRMFYGCTALETITLPETITEIAAGAFYDCQSLKEIEIPEGVEEIAAITFGRNIHLAKVTLPDNLYRIGYEAFDRCLYLTEIDIPDSVEWIEEGAFSDTGLETIKMPANLRSVSSSCFNGCKKLTSVQLNDNLSSIDQSAFDITGLSEISIPINVRIIGQRAFGCNMSGTVEGFIVYGHSDVAKEYAEKFDLTYEAKHELVTDESEIETVVKGAVAATTTTKGYTGDTYCKQCDQLIARGTEIPVKTTSGSSGTGSNNPTNTENQSSASNTTTNASVAEPDQPNQSQLAAAAAVEQIKAIGTITLDKKDAIDKARAAYNALSDDAKKHVSEADLKLLTDAEAKYDELKAAKEAAAEEAAKKAEEEKAAAEAAKKEAVGAENVVGDVTYVVAENQTVIFKAPSKKDATSVKIPETIQINGKDFAVTEIAADAFKNNKKLTKVTIPKNIKVIGKNAFQNCNALKTVTIGSKVTTIGDGAFQGCSKLTKVTIPAKVTKIGKNAFSGCKKLKTITIKSTSLKTISKSAFKNIAKNATIKVPKKKLAAYKKLLKKSGLASKVKVTK